MRRRYNLFSRLRPVAIAVPVLACMVVVPIVFAKTHVAIADVYEVGQKNKSFSTTHLKINVGDTVSFPNHDPFFHNIFSASSTKFFDLGSYPSGETREVVFDQAGQVEIECAIHPFMHMVIEVQ